MMTDMLAAKAASVFAALGGELVDPPTLMPASLPLELSGEAVRQRLCVFVDHEGNEQALRPDLTLPTALAEISARRAGAGGMRVSRYAARAFRLPADGLGPTEFVQVGAERYGAANSPEIDASLFHAVVAAADAAGARADRAMIGDLAVFPAFVDALVLPDGSATALKAAFRQAGGVDALFRRPAAQPDSLARRVAELDLDAAAALVEVELARAGRVIQGGRTVEEIALRLMAQGRDQGLGDIPDAVKAQIKTVLSFKAPVKRAAADLLALLAPQINVAAGLRTQVEVFAARMALIGNDLPDDAHVSLSFGRRFTYYDGFVFELFRAGAPLSQPFAAGGRYDALLSNLSGGDVDATAIGGVVRPDRMGASQ